MSAQSPYLSLLEGQVDEFDVRAAVVIGQETTVVWDTLSHPRDMKPALSLCGSKRLVVVYSHADWDHIWGTSAIPYQEVIGHRACYERFFADVPLYLREKQRREPGQWEEVALVPPTVTFDSQMNVDLGGMTLELHHLPGHTRDCCVGFIPELGILLAGDVVETPLPVVEEDSPIARWIDGLKRWANDQRVLTVVPAHGAIGDRSLITGNIKYLEDLLAGTASALVPEVMSDFYAKTHEQNQRIARQAR